MRVISGKAGSLSLRVPKSLTRPTTDRVREAVFSSLGDFVVGASVLDLFAGSGSLGIEALSRGAAEATFVDENREAVETIRKNLAATRLEAGIARQQKVSSFLSTISGRSFTLIFADPPYARTPEELDFLTGFLSLEPLSRAISPNGLLVLETFSGSPLPVPENWETIREKTYGKTRVTCLQVSP